MDPRIREVSERFNESVISEAMAALAVSTTAEEDAAITPDMLDMARAGAYFGGAMMLKTVIERGWLDTAKFTLDLLAEDPS